MKSVLAVTIAAMMVVCFLAAGCKKDEPAPPAKPTPTPAPTEVPSVAPSTMPTIPASMPATKVDSAVTDAQTSLDKIAALIKDGKLDDADTMLKALEANMSTLPAAVQDKVKAARTALDAARKASGVLSPPATGG